MAEVLEYAVEDKEKNTSLMEQDQPAQPRCFICDMIVTGRYYSLASCRAQCSRVRLIEKLGTLVGDQYMVVISEDDIICRDCASSMNTLDRLESEASSIRGIVLKFLEKKYALTDGELVNQKNTGPGQPPRIMPSTKPAQNKEKKFNTSHGSNFMARKRKAALADTSSENSGDTTTDAPDSNKVVKSHWLQCGTCKYTTTYDSFKRHHLASPNPTSVVGGNILRDKNGIDDILDNGPSTSKRKIQKISHQPEPMSSVFMKESQFSDTISPDGSQNEEMSIIATDLASFAVDSNFNANEDAEDSETIKVQIVRQGQRKNFVDENDVTIELADIHDDTSLENAEMITGDVGSVCVLDGGDEDMLKMAGPDGNTVYVQMIGKDKVSAEGDSLRKQLLTVNEDGTVEMVEVLWDENEMRQNAEEDGDQSPFQ